MRVVPGVPMDHTSFVYDLVDALRPRLVVDVGTGAGAALSVLCQSMRDHDVDGTAYGIDTWADDVDKSEDDETRWASLNNFFHTYFRGNSYLLQMPPSAALAHFADGSIDLLRLDVRRAGAPLATLLEAWRPRLARGGVLLCPGVSDPENAALGAEWMMTSMEGAGATVFPHGKGLGVLCSEKEAGDGRASDLLDLLRSPSPDDHEGLARFYDHADRYHAARLLVHDKRFGLHRRK